MGGENNQDKPGQLAQVYGEEIKKADITKFQLIGDDKELIRKSLQHSLESLAHTSKTHLEMQDLKNRVWRLEDSAVSEIALTRDEADFIFGSVRQGRRDSVLVMAEWNVRQNLLERLSNFIDYLDEAEDK